MRASGLGRRIVRLSGRRSRPPRPQDLRFARPGASRSAPGGARRTSMSTQAIGGYSPSLLPTLARLKRIGKAHSKFGSPNLSLTAAVTKRGAWPKQRCRDR